MNCQILYTTVLTVAIASVTAYAEVKVIDHTEQTRQEIENTEMNFPDADDGSLYREHSREVARAEGARVQKAT